MYREKQLTNSYRLMTPTVSKMDAVLQSVTKPDGYLPPVRLATWKNMPLEQNLPMIPAPPGKMYFTRGGLSRSLIRKGHKHYSLADPKNRMRVPTNKYEILHDPYLALGENPYLFRRLLELELVNESGEVISTLKDFNRYRRYLSTLYKDNVRERLARMDQLDALERQQTRAFLMQEYNNNFSKIRDERIEQAQEFVKYKGLDRQFKFEDREITVNQQMELLYDERRRKQEAKAQQNAERKIITEQMKRNRKREENRWRKQVLHKSTLQDMKAMAQKDHVRKNHQINRERYLTEWFERKIISSAQRLEKEQEIQDEFTERIRKRGVLRQKRIEQLRDDLPYRIARRLAEEKRLENIVRKYAMRWLNRVRARLNKPRDELHESLWAPPNKHALQECVNELYIQSGHNKLGDVVLNLLQFKDNLKRMKQMAAAQKERDDDDEDDE